MGLSAFVEDFDASPSFPECRIEELGLGQVIGDRCMGGEEVWFNLIFLHVIFLTEVHDAFVDL